MKKMIGSLALVTASLTCQMASADSYWGFGYSDYELNASDSGLGMKADVNTIEGVYGINSTANIAYEVRAGLGLKEEDIVFSYQGESATLGITNELTSYFSFYVKPHIAKDNFDFYGLLGYSRVANTITDTENSQKEDTTDSGISYGLGAGVSLPNNSSLVLEWKNLADIDGGDIRGFTLGLQHSF